MKLGLVGLPNVGKSTLFNAIVGTGQAAAANYPFCTIEPNVGVVPVPDRRLDVLSEMYHPEKYTPAVIEFVDIAGLVAGASKGEGLGNKFLSHIREVDAIIHVVRCFEDTDVIHVAGSVDARRDIEIINLELVFADIDIAARRLDKAEKTAKADKKYAAEVEILTALVRHLEDGKPARSFSHSEDKDGIVASMPLLSGKPVIYAANLSENDLLTGADNNRHYTALAAIAKEEGAGVLPICARIEEEIAPMSREDREMFLGELGLEESGLDRLIKEGYKLLGLISFLTAGEKEVRAWTIPVGTTAPGAAGKIHSDFERGFIRAEVVSYDALVAAGSTAAARAKGLLRLEGKTYVVQDGDVIVFRFNV